MVLDRLFLWIFTTACVLGTAGIILQAPNLYDKQRPIDVQYSKIAKAKMMQMEPEEDWMEDFSMILSLMAVSK